MIDYDLIQRIGREARQPADDGDFERQVIRATNKLAYEGRYVANPMLASCAEIMLANLTNADTAKCSDGRKHHAYFAPAAPFSVGRHRR